MDPRTRRVIIHINDNFHRRLTCDDIARVVNMSPSRLRHMFKEETGVSLLRHLKAIRMRKAKELLETTFLSVKEVMARVGMSDESHFVRDFKRECNMTPSQYRIAFSVVSYGQSAPGGVVSHMSQQIAAPAN